MISGEEKKILEKLSIPALRFLSKIAEDKDFQSYKTLISELVDYEMERTFALPENDNLLKEHAYSRGRVAGYLQSAHLMMAARGEIERREKRRQEAKK